MIFTLSWKYRLYVLFRYLSPQGFSSLRGRHQVITEFAPQLVCLVTLAASQASVYWWELKVAVGVCGRVLDLSVCLRGKKPPHWGSRSRGVDTSTAGHGRVSERWRNEGARDVNWEGLHFNCFFQRQIHLYNYPSFPQNSSKFVKLMF